MEIAANTDLEALYLNNQTADVYFICLADTLRKERIPAHRYVLASKSPPFFEMFYGNFPKTGDITLSFVTAKAFKVFLQLFYYTQANVTMETVREVIDLSKQYQMTQYLSVACSASIIKNISTENFIVAYELALQFDMMELKLFCEISAPVLLTEQNIYNCSKSQLKHILQIKQLYAELDLVDICTEWARISCERQDFDATDPENIRSELRDCIQFLDFASMSTQKIQEALVKCGEILNKGDLLKIIGILMTRGAPLDVDRDIWVASENERNKRIIEPIETMTLLTDKQISLKSVAFSPVYWENQSNDGQNIYGQLVIMKESNETKVLLRESFNIQPLVEEDGSDVGNMLQFHQLATSLTLEPNQTHFLQIQLMLQYKGEIYSRSLILDRNHISYNRASGSPTKIVWQDNTIIASFGIGVEYIDPESYESKIRPMQQS